MVWLRDVGDTSISWEPAAIHTNVLHDEPLVKINTSKSHALKDQIMSFYAFQNYIFVRYAIAIPNVNQGKICLPPNNIWIVLQSPLARKHNLVGTEMLSRDLHEVWKASDSLYLKRVYKTDDLMKYVEIDTKLGPDSFDLWDVFDDQSTPPAN